MEPDNVLEEGRRYSGSGVRVAQGDEVVVLGQSIDHCQDHRLAVHLWESFYEVHRDVLLHHRRHIQRLQQSGRMQMLCFMELVGGAALDELSHAARILWHEEGATQSDESLVDALVTHAVGVLQNCRIVAG
jgi:hypothetical protein